MNIVQKLTVYYPKTARTAIPANQTAS